MNKIEELLENIDKLTNEEKVDLLKKSLVNISVNDWLILANQLKEEFGLSAVNSEAQQTNEEEVVQENSSKSIFIKKLPEGLQKCFPIFKSLAQLKNSDLLTIRNELSQAFIDDSVESLEKRLIKRDVTPEEINTLTTEFTSYGAEVEIK